MSEVFRSSHRNR